MKRHLLVFLILCAFISPRPAAAHNPGMSVVDVEVEQSRITARVGLARRSAESLLGLDRQRGTELGRGDGNHALERIAREMIVLRIAGRRLVPKRIVIEPEQADGLRFTITFPPADGNRLEMHSPLISLLERGHRQFLTVKSNLGVFRRAVLSEENASLAVAIPESPVRGGTFVRFVAEGVRHLWIGLDHILFLIALLLPAVLSRVGRRWEPAPALWPALIGVASVATAFTLAHSVTLSLAVLGWVTPPPRWVEAAIAATVILAALNNLCPVVQGRRWVIAFGLGLVHGFGFAGALVELGLPSGELFSALAGFNFGIELGQLAIVLILVPGAYLMRATSIYRRVILVGGSTAVASIAAVWFIERSLNRDLLSIV